MTDANATSKTSYKIPRVITNERIEDEDYQAKYYAALKHGKQLNKAECDLEVARDLCVTLRGFLSNQEVIDNIGDCYTADTVVELIEKRIRKARQRMDMHSSDHKNLFIAYFDLKTRLDGSVS